MIGFNRDITTVPPPWLTFLFLLRWIRLNLLQIRLSRIIPRDHIGTSQASEPRPRSTSKFSLQSRLILIFWVSQQA